MLTSTLRQALLRHRAAAKRWASSAALLSVVTTAVIGPVWLPEPTQGPLPTATANITTTKIATIETANPAVAAKAAAPSKPTTAAAKAISPPSSTWQLANIASSRVDSWLHRFTTSLKGDIEAALERGKEYIPMISSKLAARGMPQELKYLPLIESDYKPTARSRVSAVGLWQFMAGTARALGLSIGSHGDQRKDPAKETDAALTYLSDLYHQFGSWYLAAAAYNAGPGTVKNAMQHVLGRTTGSDADFYKISGSLPAETRDYVPKLIAAATIGKDPAKYGLAG
jgi:membrane-bound lytic murein transglycosylase D